MLRLCQVMSLPLPDCVVCRATVAAKPLGYLGHVGGSQLRYFFNGSGGARLRADVGWDTPVGTCWDEHRRAAPHSCAQCSA